MSENNGWISRKDSWIAEKKDSEKNMRAKSAQLHPASGDYKKELGLVMFYAV